MNDDAFGRFGETAIQREFNWACHDRRSRSTRQRLSRLSARGRAVAMFNLVEVNAHVARVAREPEEKILQSEIVKHEYSASSLHRFEDAVVVTMVVTHVIDDGIEVGKCF